MQFGMRVSAVLYVMKVPIEGETPDLSRVTRPDDVAELHGPLESLMRTHCIHEQGERHGVASALLHPWPNVNDAQPFVQLLDRKSTRLNSSHVRISYAVFC